MSSHPITVTRLPDGRWTCDPTTTHVNGGDTIDWKGDGLEISVSDVDPAGVIGRPRAPFDRLGPIKPPHTSLVSRRLGRGQRFVALVNGEPCEGQIIVDNP